MWQQLGRHRRWIAGPALLLSAAGAGVTFAYCDKEADKKQLPFFDPEALERGAKAVREIDASKNAALVYAKLIEDAKAKQAEETKLQAQAEAQAKQYQLSQEQVSWEQRRKAQEEQAQYQAQLAQQNHDLAQQRQSAEHDLQRKRNAELVSMQEESARRQLEQQLRLTQQIEAEKTAAEQKRVEMQKQVVAAQAAAEWEGRRREYRDNFDLHYRETQMSFQERAKGWATVAHTVFTDMGSGARTLLGNPTYMLALVGGVGGVCVAYFASKNAFRVAGEFAMLRLTTPNLIRETSRWSLWSWLLGKQRGAVTRYDASDANAAARQFKDIVLQRGLHDHIRRMSAAAANTRLHGAPFRHMLFYGPPGTGKTMVAKRIAKTSGLDFAIMSGGDVAPLGGAAVTQLHEVFDWASTSRKGVVLFIDEADAFLSGRNAAMSEGLRSALNAVLFRTGDQSRDFMLVLATNRPGDLDAAMLDRCDDALEFGLPSENERFQLLKLYFQKYILNEDEAESRGVWSRASAGFEALRRLLRGQKAAADRIRVQGVGDEQFHTAASLTEGFSGRELAKLVASVQATVYGGTDTKLTPQIFDAVVRRKVEEHQHRMHLRNAV